MNDTKELTRRQALVRLGELVKEKSVAIIGAGVSGFTSAYELTQAGFDVTIFEASHRMGGRSLTLRQGDSFNEVDRQELTCEFPTTDSNNNDVYLNAGPGRIPQHHALVLEYCRQWNVPLEPFIFAARGNLLQADAFNNGKPMTVRQIKHTAVFNKVVASFKQPLLTAVPALSFQG